MMDIKTQKQPSLHRIQYTLEKDEFVKLKTFCFNNGVSMKELTRSLVTDFLENKITDGVE